MVLVVNMFRSEQARESIVALEAGISVYAEKPWWNMRRLVQGGTIGEVVQILAQKSYPYGPGRPTSEKIDGGLIAQNGVHAMRFVEHITGIKAITVRALSTGLGEIRSGSDLKIASSIMGTLENGGLYTIIANYLNPRGFGSWGNEMVRIFGTRGMVEAVDAGTKTRLVVGNEDRGPLDLSETPPDWLEMVLDHIQGEYRFPFSLADELHPTRMVLRVAESAKR